MSRAYDKSAKAAAAASGAAHSRDISSLHDLAASQHRIAAEHALQAGMDEKVKEHRHMADMHASAAYSATAKDHPDTAKGGEQLTGKQIHLGAKAHADFKLGKNPPSWVEDEGKWDKAKEAASKSYDMDDDAFWPVVVSIYENMGGSVGKEAKARMAARRLGVLAARRMDGDKELQASVKANGFSFSDLQQEIAEACEELDQFQSEGAVGPCPWVTDIIAPEHEEGETWEAIVGTGNDLYCVKFKINGDQEVEIVGEPEEVTRTTDYEYVGDMEAEARKADEAAGIKLEAGDFRGNQHKSAKDLAEEHSTAANVASRTANKASKEAEASDGDKGLHDKAAALHESARQAHETASAKHESAGDKDKAQEHTMKASQHLAKKEEHGKAMEKAAMAKNAPVNGALDCARSGADAMRGHLESPADVIMYMPGGLHQITPSLQDGTEAGTPVEVVVLVDAAAADTIERQRLLMEKAGKKPFFSVQHSTEIAAAWPKRFFWDKRLDATGSLAEGIWAEVEWTKSGAEAVTGKDFRTFSPTFFVDAVRNTSEHPAKIVCQAGARANMGALENDPAFQKISPLWAKNAGKPDPAKAVRATKFIKQLHEELRASNPTLSMLADEIFARKQVRVSEEEIGTALLEAAEATDASEEGYETHNKTAHEATKAAHGMSASMDHRDAKAHLEAAKAHLDASAAHSMAKLKAEDPGKDHHDKMADMHKLVAKHHELMAEMYDGTE